jgi:hypothetical protein
MVDKSLVAVAGLFMFVVVVLMIVSSGGYYYYTYMYNKKTDETSSSSGNYKPFTSSYEKIVQDALASNTTPADNAYLLAKTEFLTYKNNTTDRTKWAFQENSADSAIYAYKQKNTGKTGTDEYKEILGYETELNALKKERNNTLATAQCPSGPYPANPAGPTQCATLYGPNSSGVMKNSAGCKADPKCKLVKNAFGGNELCLSCDNPMLTSGVYTIL